MWQKRMTLWIGLVAVLALLLASCAAPAAAPAGETAAAPGEEAAGGGGRLEVFSWWTSGGEADALQALFDAYSARYPDVEIINATVAGGGGSAARAVLQTRLQGGDVPDTWQLHPGWELLGQYVEGDFVRPVTSLYEEEGWQDVVPEALRGMMTKDGEIYMVTVGIHRGNGFWYNKKLLGENGIEVGDTMSIEQFFEYADKLAAAGVTPLCLGTADGFPAPQLFENTLLGTIGPEQYRGLWDGSVAFDDPGVKQAMETYGKMLDYVNSDYSALTWNEAVAALIEGRCAFNSMGDWAYGEFVKAQQVDNEDFGWVSHPGTDGSFMIVADGFPVGNGAPDEENAVNWLRVLGSKEAQEAFNPLKGSICARTDCDRAKFGPYHNWAMDSFAGDALVPSVVHGSAAPASMQQALSDATIAFMVDRNVDAYANALVAGAAEAGIGQ